MSLTRSLGQFVANLSPNPLPQEAVRITRAGFIDAIGTIIAGRNEDSVRIMGHPSRPLTDQQIFEKISDCLDAGDSPIAAEVLFKHLSAIQSIRARDLTARA